MLAGPAEQISTRLRSCTLPARSGRISLCYLPSHPSSPVLILEAAESSLALDREIKGSLYARAQIADYWIVNLVDHVLEVYRDPEAAPASPYGWRYASRDVTTRCGPPRSVADRRDSARGAPLGWAAVADRGFRSRSDSHDLVPPPQRRRRVPAEAPGPPGIAAHS